MGALFKNGSFPDYKNVTVDKNPIPMIQDKDKIRTWFSVEFAAAAPGSKEPELFFRTQNLKRESNYKFYVVPYTIKVNETVEGIYN
jgi:hypothetical protein